MPLAVENDHEWQLGTTVAITGLTSVKGSPFNGRVGRISGFVDGRWEVTVRGPDGLGTVNIKPSNLCAATDIDAILRAWRDIPNHSQMPPAARPKDQRALHAVALRDGRELARLVHAGADLGATDAKGRTALHLALEMLETRSKESDDEEEALLSQALSDVPGADAPRADEIELVRALLVAPGAHLDARDAQQRTPLLASARACLPEASRLLLAARADPHALDAQGNNALHHAVMQRDAATVRLLLEPETAAGSPPPLDVDGLGKGGWTPLGLAARAGDVDVAETLLEHGAAPDAVAYMGKNALDIAKANKRAAMVALLAAQLERCSKCSK